MMDAAIFFNPGVANLDVTAPLISAGAKIDQ